MEALKIYMINKLKHRLEFYLMIFVAGVTIASRSIKMKFLRVVIDCRPASRRTGNEMKNYWPSNMARRGQAGPKQSKQAMKERNVNRPRRSQP